jgi:hypothetical protein
MMTYADAGRQVANQFDIEKEDPTQKKITNTLIDKRKAEIHAIFGRK